MSLQFLTHQVAHLEGKLYSGNISEIQFKIETALDSTSCLVLNLNNLKMLDVSGALMLFTVSKKAQENNKEIILLCTDNDWVKFVFTLVRIPYYNSLPEII